MLHLSDPRGLAIRSVAYLSAATVAVPRVTRAFRDAAGRVSRQWDPRMWALHETDERCPANLLTRHALSGQVLSTHSVDAGWRVNLFGDAAQPLQAWDGRGCQRVFEYDDALRPLAIFEDAACTERFLYGTALATGNQCGQVVRHDDPAGTRYFEAYSLGGDALVQAQRFLQTLDPPDWPTPLEQRDAMLEPGAGAVSEVVVNALAEVVEHTDALGHRQGMRHTPAGQLREAWLHINGTPARQTVVSQITYGAQGLIEAQTLGNGVQSAWRYRPHDGRLSQLCSRRASGEVLQDLNYAYDPVGNILSIEDKALPVRHFANQRIDPISRYRYDSLYQLIEATGFEAGSARQGPLHFTDPQALANYRQTYRYDAGGNLLELIHQGSQQHGRVLTAAKYSNRCLPQRDGHPPDEAEIAAGFDANGNLQALEKSRGLTWNVRNQLASVQPVQRSAAVNDTECYVYGGGGLRQRKLTAQLLSGQECVREVRYLPRLELHIQHGTDQLRAIIAIEAGGQRIEVVLDEQAAARFSYPMVDHLRSCLLELDGQGALISRFTYHPFGTTATGSASGPRHRFGGREQDATGLYDFGRRYYIPWLQRWASADPAGAIDGLNLYCMVANRPLVFRDADGQVKVHADGMEMPRPEPMPVADEPTPPAALSSVPGAFLAAPLSADQPAKPKPRWTVERYLRKAPPGQRTLVVGCGASPEGTTVMGFAGTPCSLGQRHEHDFTVDIDEGARADLTFDFTLYKGTALGRAGAGQFDTVSFEYLSRGPRYPFKEAHFELWISAADELLVPGGEVFFYNALDEYRALAEKALKARGFSVARRTLSQHGAHVEHIRGAEYIVGTKPRQPASALLKWAGLR